MHTPHPYQRKLLADIKAAYRACVARGVEVPVIAVQLPTGGGKTLIEVIVALGAVRKVREGRPPGRVMIATGREELVLQAAADIREETPCGVVMAGYPASPELPIQVCSIPTLTARAYAPDGVTVIIFDEGHHLKADTWGALVGIYTDLEMVLVFTATPIGLGGVCHAIVKGPSVAELEAIGTLVRSRVWRPGKATKALARDPVDVLLAHRDRLSVTFAASVEESKDIAARACSAGLRICHVDGNTRKRGELLAGLGREWDGVTNFNVLTEGWNCPPISLCVLAAPTQSLIAYLQRVGRVLRAAPGKADAWVYDLLGVSWKLGRPDDKRAWTLDSKSGRVVGVVGSTTCGKCGFGYRWAPRCPECGWRSAPRPRMRVKWSELTEAERAEKAPPPERVLASFMAQAETRGWKPGAVMARFRGVFGRDATADERAAARVIFEERKVA